MTVDVIGGPASWKGSAIGATWLHEVDDAQRAELVRLARDVTAALGERTEAQLPTIERSSLTMPALAPMLDSLHTALTVGEGFALVRGLPVDDLDEFQNVVMYWCLSLQLGVPIHQNLQRAMIIHVRDQGKDYAQLGVRSYETAAQLEYHSDSSDVVGLYCLRPARIGGTSTIVSSVAIHDEIVRRRPDLAPLLYEPWPQANPLDSTVTWKPVCARNDAGQLFTKYGRLYMETAWKHDASVARLDHRRRELLDLYDELANSTEFLLDMSFQAGDAQFLNNFVTMHSRTEYADWPEPERARELLRMWLVLPEGLDVPPVFEDSGFVPRNVAFGR